VQLAAVVLIQVDHRRPADGLGDALGLNIEIFE
jgi:hypothetical protein